MLALFALDTVMNAMTRETWEGQTLFSLQATVRYPGKPKKMVMKEGP